jgi:DNA-binding winged helix-turn-helix (wHTH) protein/TolB-like protein
MAMSRESARVYEFGPFQLKTGEYQLLRDGAPVALTPKAFETLAVLVENNGRLVKKEELMTAVWPDAFVEEAGLTRNVSMLRKAMGRDSAGHHYIETVPKLGYRFVGAVKELDDSTTAVLMERHTVSQVLTIRNEEIVEVDASANKETPTAGHDTLRRITQGLPIRFTLTVTGLACLLAYIFLHHTSASEPAARIKSIAVLPFQTIGADPGEEHQGLSMADILITRLSNIRELTVRPTSAILAFENQTEDSIAIGQRMNVDAVLEGTIHRSSDRVRVTARLIRIKDGSAIWTGQFERLRKEELRLQDELNLQLADAVLVNLQANERSALTKRYTENADAYQLYLKGRYQWNLRNAEGMAEAERLFRNAIEKDPNFALAYVGLADRLATTYTGEARLAVEKALELDPNLAEAHATLGFIQMFHEWRWREAEQSFQRSIELNPGYATAHHWYATLLEIESRNEEAKAEFRRALEISPLSHNFLADLGQAYYFEHDYDNAKAYCRRSLEIYPDFHFAHAYLSDIFLQTGEYDAAVDELLKADGSPPSSSTRPAAQTERAQAYASKFGDIYRQRGIKGFIAERFQPDSKDGTAYVCAKAYAFLGDKEKALDNLEDACRSRAFMVAFAKAEPAFDPLRSEPRYQAILTRMGLLPQ